MQSFKKFDALKRPQPNPVIKVSVVVPVYNWVGMFIAKKDYGVKENLSKKDRVNLRMEFSDNEKIKSIILNSAGINRKNAEYQQK